MFCGYPDTKRFFFFIIFRLFFRAVLRLEKVNRQFKYFTKAYCQLWRVLTGYQESNPELPFLIFHLFLGPDCEWQIRVF